MVYVVKICVNVWQVWFNEQNNVYKTPDVNEKHQSI